MVRTQIYCERHKDFKEVTDFFKEWDTHFQLMKLMAKLECDCVVWIATIETNIEALK